ncbi:MAG TPA: acetyl-CoA carboxylase biotin carboxyl carrier protein [Beijerinckiaceae bacterium]|nr:acetyl-CoA carboxylase biotin carboxyl carrier protein [Beijerinckiaceae bacterium]
MSEHDQGDTPGREHSDETAGANSERAGGGERGGAAGRHGGGGRRGRRGGGHSPQPPQRQQQQGQQRRAESSLNMDELRELTELFTTHGLTDFEFENADIRVRLSRNPAPQSGGAAAPGAFQNPASAMSHAANAPATGSAAHAAPPAAATEAPRAEEKAEDLHVITSPIVGTFYRSPSPDAEPFIRVGSVVEPDTVVCIIEAMKLMNEIQAETGGAVEKIYVENGQPVEYGQPLFGVKK